MNIKILVVDDHPLFLAGILAVLNTDSNITVVGEAKNGEIAIRKAKELQPDIIVMDISMPGIDGIEATKQILQQSNKIKVLALSIHTGKRFVKEMLGAGASGYLPKDIAADEILAAIDQISKGNMYLSPTITSVALMEDAEPEKGVNTHILKTKLYRPQILKDYVIRKEIIEILDKNQQNPLSLIVAPAGYGKSVAVSEWLDTTKSLYAWISLDEEHDQLRTFLQYMVTALEDMFPGTFIEMTRLLEAKELPPVKTIALALINELDFIKQDYILVLDDYHKIGNESIHSILSELLKYPPECMHLSIITRRDPPIQIQRLRLSNRLADVRMKDLSFNKQELKELFFKLHQIELSDSIVSSLIEKTEGWITGICLAIMNVQDPGKLKDLPVRMDNDLYPFSQFLLEEVLSKLDEEFQDILLSISVLDRFSAELVDEFLNAYPDKYGISGGSDFITQLIKTNLFLIPLDNQNKWFRFHHLFQELLQNQLKSKKTAGEIKQIYELFGQWNANQGLLEEAIAYLVRGGSEQMAAETLINNRVKLQTRDSWERLRNCHSKLPEQIQNNTHELLIIKAWIGFYHLDFQGIAFCMEQIEKLPNDNNSLMVQGEIDFFKGYFSYFLLQPEACETFLKSATEKIPDTNPGSLGEAELHYALALILNNRKDEGLSFIRKIENQNTDLHSIRITRLNAGRFFIHLMDANFNEVVSPARLVQKIGVDNSYPYALGWGRYAEALELFYQGRFAKSDILFSKLIDNPRQLHTRMAADCFIAKIINCLLNGEYEASMAILEKFKVFSDEIEDASVKTVLQTFQIRIALMQGDMEQAIQLSNTIDLSTDVGLMLWWIEIPRITMCRLLIAMGTTESLNEAVSKLNNLLKENEFCHNKCQAISIQVLLAITHYKVGEKEKALDQFVNCLKRTQQGSFIYPYLEHAEIVTELLDQLTHNEQSSKHIDEIVSAIAKLPGKSIKRINIIKSNNVGDGSESISKREQELLQLISDGYRNKEIAAKLYISENTVKKHIYNIFQKLGVQNRVELINKISELELL